MADFYTDTLNRLLRSGQMDRKMHVLVVCGGDDDARSFRECGFESVVISNLDPHRSTVDVGTYAWCRQDAESLTLGDASFDLCAVHSGLHHCQSPHRALGEMLRVARIGVLLFEPLDNLITSLGMWLGLGEEYEVASVVGQGGEVGGLRNTCVPNHIYRWTEREIEKTVKSYAPVGPIHFRYFYQTRLNWMRAKTMRRPWLRWAFFVLGTALKGVTCLYPRAANNFAAFVAKPRIPEQCFPWLQSVDGQLRLNQTWVASRFDIPGR